MKSATSAREMLKPRGGRCSSRDSSLGKACWSVWADALWSNRAHFVQTLVPWRKRPPRCQKRPRRYAGGMTAFLNRKATDSITTRFTPAITIALVNATANCCRRFASALDMGTRTARTPTNGSLPLNDRSGALQVKDRDSHRTSQSRHIRAGLRGSRAAGHRRERTGNSFATSGPHSPEDS